MKQEQYEAYRSLLQKTLAEQSDRYDKAVLVVSSSAIGISFSFIGEWVPDLGASKCLPLLFFGWVMLGLSILSNVFSHLSSSWDMETLINSLDDSYARSENFEYQKTFWRNATSFLNPVSGMLMTAGIASILFFVSQNILTG